MLEPRPGDAVLDDCAQRATERLLLINEEIRLLDEANPQLEEGAFAVDFTATGRTAFGTALFYGWVTCRLTFNSGERMRFDAKMWGLGLGGGHAQGGGVFGWSPNNLVGKASFQITAVSKGMAINWWRGSQYLGNYFGVVAGLNVSATGGEGEWSRDF